MARLAPKTNKKSNSPALAVTNGAKSSAIPTARKSRAGKTVPAGPDFIRNEEELAEAVRHLHRADPDCIGVMLELTGAPPLRARTPGLGGLVWIIISQQVSTASARAIQARFTRHFGEIHHRQLLAASDDDFRACGLSAPKIRTLRRVAEALDSGALDLDRIAGLSIAEARAMMTAVKGIGPWTCDIYLLFCLGHPDIWPAGDLALQEGVRHALGLRKRPDAVRLEKLSRRWQPYRAAAARLVWAYYGKMQDARRAETSKSKTRPRE